MEYFKFKNKKNYLKILNGFVVKANLTKHLTKKKKTKILNIYLMNIIFELFFFPEVFKLQNKILFMVHSNKKQYFLSFIGFNFKHFSTVSTGKLLKFLEFSDYKKFKKHKKNLKILVKYFKETDLYYKSQNNFIFYYYLKPLNLKNLLFIYELLKDYSPLPCIFGYQNYYKSIFSRVQRIKKRIKKKLLKNYTFVKL